MNKTVARTIIRGYNIETKEYEPLAYANGGGSLTAHVKQREGEMEKELKIKGFREEHRWYGLLSEGIIYHHSAGTTVTVESRLFKTIIRVTGTNESINETESELIGFLRDNYYNLGDNLL